MIVFDDLMTEAFGNKDNESTMNFITTKLSHHNNLVVYHSILLLNRKPVRELPSDLYPVWQNLAFKDRIRMAYQGDFRSSKALLTNQELRLKQQRQQIVDGLY